MKKGSTLFLKIVILVIALAVLGLFGIVIPMEMVQGDGAGVFYVFWALIYLTIIPFYVALYQGIKLLGYIDKNTAFSQDSVVALNKIKFCAVVISALYLACLPFVFMAAELDDAPGLIIVWMAVTGGPVVIAVFAAVLKRLLQNILEIKSENDLTV